MRKRKGMYIHMNYSAVKHRLKRRLLALALAGCVMGTMTACGKKEGDRVDPVKEWVYVPEFIGMGDSDNIDYYEIQCSRDSLYYPSYSWDEETGESTQKLCRYSLKDGTTTELVLDWGDEQENRNLNRMVFASDGSIYALVRSYFYDEATQSGRSTHGLAKFGADGKLVFFRDVTENLEGGERGGYVYINGIALDSRGRIYVAGESGVYLFDEGGAYKGTVSVGNGMEGRIQAIGADRDGKVYAFYYNYGGDGINRELVEIDYDSQKTGASYEDFPQGNSEELTPGAEPGTFLVSDGDTVYEYSLETQTKTALFDWLDSDINGNYVRSMSVAEDGRILAVIYDWDSEEGNGVAYLTKKKGSEVAQKETILIGTLNNGWALRASAVIFNRQSDKYHVTIKQYMNTDNVTDQESYMAAYQDAITNLNNDLTSRANCPDIIDLDGLNARQLVSKGLIVDLGKYLDKSGTLKREEFVKNILDAYTYDGVLTCIPTGFELSTIIGKTSDVGEKQGWTLQELIAYADRHPDARLFDNVSKTEIMYYLLAYNEEVFIDWSKGKCNFDSDEFKSLLAFVNRFPSEISREDREISTPTKIQRGEVLLDTVSIYDFDHIQMYYEIFGGDITCKGLPTSDDSIGTALSASGLYCITSKASRPEGAWEFLEHYLQQDSDRYTFGFPTRKAKLDEMAKEAVTVEYWTDENGNPILDENGNPIEKGGSSSIGYQDGWSYTYRKATQEEVDLVLQLIDQAKPVNLGIMQILNLIDEDAAAYFEGQKTVDEVVKVIQNRVQLYVDVNN